MVQNLFKELRVQFSKLVLWLITRQFQIILKKYIFSFDFDFSACELLGYIFIFGSWWLDDCFLKFLIFWVLRRLFFFFCFFSWPWPNTKRDMEVTQTSMWFLTVLHHYIKADPVNFEFVLMDYPPESIVLSHQTYLEECL